MAPRALIFDLDGTIWDSIPWFAHLIEAQGGPAANLSEQQLRLGNSIVAILNQCRLSRSPFMRFAITSISSLTLYPGIGDVLKVLTSKKEHLAVFTSLPGSISMPMLSALGIGRYFGAVIHAGNCRQGKPNPAGILAALGTFGLNAGPHTYFIGDRDVDSKTAQNAGVSFAWASYGYQPDRPAFVTVGLVKPINILSL
jgi:HAD superfamily hydrolase (TIGR01509 family)